MHHLLQRYRASINPPYGAKDYVTLSVTVLLLITIPVILLVSHQRQTLEQHAASLFPNAPDTTNNIHVGLPAMTNITSGSQLLATTPPVDEVWDWNGGGAGSSYPTIYKGEYFPVDRQPDIRYNAGAQQLTWFQTNHPDWIEYQCDKTTIAYEFGQTTDIPLDTSNPATLSWLESTFYTPAATSGNYQHLDFDNFQFSNAGSYSGQRCGHWSGTQGSSTWIQQYSGTSNDPAYRANEITMAKNLQAWLHTNHPSIQFAANFSYDNLYPTDSDSLMGYVDLLFDEQGFTNGNNGPPYYYADSGWIAKAAHLASFLSSGHAWQDINQFGSSFSTLTTSQKQWAIANYLLLKNNASWIYICGPQEYGTLLMAPEYATQIGSPTNTYYSSQNVYMRDFTNGKAIVNPSSTTTFTVSLPGNTYQDLYGNLLGTSLILNPTSGIVVLCTSTNCGTPQPTQTPAPTSTPVPNFATLSLIIKPHGLGNSGDNVNPTGGNLSPLHSQRAVVVTLYDQNNVQVPSTPVPNTVMTYDSNPLGGTDPAAKEFTLSLSLPSSVPSGSYTFRVQSPGFLTAFYTGVVHLVVGQTTSIPPVSLVTGDLNGDNVLDIKDYNQLLTDYGKTVLLSAPLPTSDLNDDGVVSIADFNLLIREFSTQRGI